MKREHPKISFEEVYTINPLILLYNFIEIARTGVGEEVSLFFVVLSVARIVFGLFRLFCRSFVFFFHFSSQFFFSFSFRPLPL